MRLKKTAVILCAVLLFSLLVTFAVYKLKKSDEVAPSVPASSEILVFEDMPYGTHPNQTFDLNLPAGTDKETGLVLFLHGGGWIGGDKSSVKKSYKVFSANSDYATASINYRFINDGESDIHDIIEDITLALSQIKIFASTYSVNLTKVILGGHSAGGHLSLLYAYKYKDISPLEPVGVFASAPVPDLSLEAFYTDNTFGDEKRMCSIMSLLCGKKFTAKTRRTVKDLLKEHSPISYVSDASVPTIILHGSNDTIAPPLGSLILAEELKKRGINHELVFFENAGHSMKNCEETRKYASELMLRCVEEWFGITTE